LRHCRQAISASQKNRGAIINLFKKTTICRNAGTFGTLGQHANLKNKKSHQEEKRQQEETDYAEPRNPD
jgi:hypothetical protein